MNPDGYINGKPYYENTRLLSEIIKEGGTVDINYKKSPLGKLKSCTAFIFLEDSYSSATVNYDKKEAKNNPILKLYPKAVLKLRAIKEAVYKNPDILRLLNLS